jgi:hypothetical protein
LSWDLAAASNSFGPTNFNLLFSTDGQNFTAALSFFQVYRNSTAPTTAGGGGGIWNATTYNPNNTRTLDLSAVPGLQDAADVYFRLASSMPGSDYVRVDNFLVSGTAIPEPAAVALLGLPMLIALVRSRRVSRAARQG